MTAWKSQFPRLWDGEATDDLFNNQAGFVVNEFWGLTLGGYVDSGKIAMQEK